MQYTPPDRFVQIWNSSETLKVAARRAKTTTILASARAARFRREGWKLKKFKTGRVAKVVK